MIKKNAFRAILVVFTLVLVSCSNNDKFKIEKGKVGPLTQKTTMLELDNIFKNDSIVKNLSEGALGDNYFQDDDEYLIYEKGGKHLLTIMPKEQLDSTSTIKSIEIHDARFKTTSDIHLGSTFAEINLVNKPRVETTLSSVTLFLDDINATIAIDKEELGLKNLSPQKVTLEQIPDLAKMKSFVVWFN
ncbi:hypothetical protein H9W90_03250 [Polaribacter pectinis]|uniref:Lipoprotein n=1 Tax=Polaribacter pectinis TaxID=2738844 RepID=A0A7G9LBZ9_9FLAO|nr:hypothetical protein [Polaribacter pectinis]QNM86148.1 hypothetical protein H9W90_03250 [Polaribacter pectinis]